MIKTEQPSSIFLRLHGSIGASPQSGKRPAPLRSASPTAAGKSRPRPSQVPASPAFENQKRLFDLVTTSLVSQQAVLLHCNPATTLQANVNPTCRLPPRLPKASAGPCSPNGLHTSNSSPLALVCHLPLSLQSSVGHHLPGGASLQSRTKAGGQAVTHSLWAALWAHPSSRDTDTVHERLHVLSVFRIVTPPAATQVRPMSGVLHQRLPANCRMKTLQFPSTPDLSQPQCAQTGYSNHHLSSCMASHALRKLVINNSYQRMSASMNDK